VVNELLQNDVRNIWQDQKVEAVQLSVQEIRQRAGHFAKQTGRRNLREYIGVVFAVLVFGFYILWFPNFTVRLGASLTIAGALYVAYQLHRRGSTRNLPENCGSESCLDFHRRELERQRDALRSIWSWYLGPLIPGPMVLIIGGGFAKRPPWHGRAWIGAVVSAVLFSLVFLAIARFNRIAARRLQRQIDDLEECSKAKVRDAW